MPDCNLFDKKWLHCACHRGRRQICRRRRSTSTSSRTLATAASGTATNRSASIVTKHSRAANVIASHPARSEAAGWKGPSLQYAWQVCPAKTSSCESGGCHELPLGLGQDVPVRQLVRHRQSAMPRCLRRLRSSAATTAKEPGNTSGFFARF